MGGELALGSDCVPQAWRRLSYCGNVLRSIIAVMAIINDNSNYSNRPADHDVVWLLNVTTTVDLVILLHCNDNVAGRKEFVRSTDRVAERSLRP